MKRKHLSGKSIGIVFGTFAPMHVGHVDLITKAKRANDNVLVIVSGSNTQKDRGTRTGLSLNRRFRYVREVFYDDELVVVDKLDEADMPPYPEGWVHGLTVSKSLSLRIRMILKRLPSMLESQSTCSSSIATTLKLK